MHTNHPQAQHISIGHGSRAARGSFKVVVAGTCPGTGSLLGEFCAAHGGGETAVPHAWSAHDMVVPLVKDIASSVSWYRCGGRIPRAGEEHLIAPFLVAADAFASQLGACSADDLGVRLGNLDMGTTRWEEDVGRTSCLPLGGSRLQASFFLRAGISVLYSGL